MPDLVIKNVKELALDRDNFRAPSQSSESAAFRALVAANPKKFWEITESLLDSGYEHVDNILVQKMDNSLVVKEGNQRIAGIKLALGLIRPQGIEIPEEIKVKMDGLSSSSKKRIQNVPCAVYGDNERELLDKIVAPHSRLRPEGRTCRVVSGCEVAPQSGQAQRQRARPRCA
jgi:hypothetical protein